MAPIEREGTLDKLSELHTLRSIFPREDDDIIGKSRAISNLRYQSQSNKINN